VDPVVPFGGCLQSQGTLGTDKRFTGQRLDNTGLYYYGARYYDPTIGRFISADSIVHNYGNPQSLNRYSYCLDNPLKYIDPTGHSPVLYLQTMYSAYLTGLIDSNFLSILLIGANGYGIGTALHETAQVVAADTISEKYGPAVLEYKIANTRKSADIVTEDGSVWEVKKLNGDSPVPQLDMYSELAGLHPGVNAGLLSKNVSLIGDIKMEVTFGKNPGQVYYQVYKTREDGVRVDVPNWQVFWEYQWREKLLELSVAACATGVILAPEIAVPVIVNIANTMKEALSLGYAGF